MSNKALLGLMIGGILFLSLLAVISLLLPKSPTPASRQETLAISNMKQLSIGTMIYMADYDDRTPPTLNWNSNIYPYVKSRDMFGSGLKGRGAQDFAYNRNVADRDSTTVDNPALTPLFFRANRIGMDLTGDKADLARDGEGALLSFLDSSTKVGPTQSEIDKYDWVPKKAKP